MPPNRKGARRVARRRNDGEASGSRSMLLPKADSRLAVFTRSLEYGFLPSGAADKANAFTFELSDFPSYTEFTALFNYMKATEFTATFTYRLSKAVSAGTSVYYPTMYLVDNSSSVLSAASTKDDFMQQRYKRFTFSPTRLSVSVRVKPRVYVTTAGGSSAPMAPLWQNTNGGSIGTLTYYGISVFTDDYNTTLGNQDGIDVVLSATIHCKGQR